MDDTYSRPPSPAGSVGCLLSSSPRGDHINIEGHVASEDDMRVHAFSASGNYYVASPNMDYVPTIVEGIVKVYLRTDGRFGRADPIICPQIHVPRFAYMAAVRKQLPPSHPYAVMWSSPSDLDFELLSGTPVHGFGFLSADFLKRFQTLATELRDRMLNHFRECAGVEAPMLRWHELSVRQALSRLRLMPASLRDQTLQLRALQRHFLLGDAYLEYHARSHALGRPLSHPSHPSEFVGAWSSSLADVQYLCAMGLPAWLVRHTSIPSQRGHLGQPVNCLPVPPEADTPSQGSPPMYIGLVGEHHLATIVQARSQYLDISHIPCVSGSDTVCPARPVSQARAHQIAAASKAEVAGSAGSPPIRRHKKRGRGGTKPYDRTASATPPPMTHGRNKFLEFDHPWMPPAISSWRRAMDGVFPAAPGSGGGAPWGYWIPEPALLISPQTRERQLRYLTNWVRARPVWLFMLQVPGSQATAVGSQFWRSYLYGVPDDFRADTRVGHRRVAIRHVFGRCFAEDRFDEDTTARVQWHGSEFREVPAELAPMVVWEAFELGFRYELLALDRYLRGTNTPDGEARREDFLARVFPNGGLLAVEELPGLESSGLFARLPHRRVTALNALRDILRLWPGCPPSVSDAEVLSGASSVTTIEAVEFSLASFYVDTFYRVAQRPPLVPHLFPTH